MRTPAVPPSVAHPPIRLRWVLLILLGAVLLCLLSPAVWAAWQLHGLAGPTASYARCMAGPAGPSVLEADPRQFWKLVRRRLVGAGHDERPFSVCSPLAAKVLGASGFVGLHALRASEFVEWDGQKTNKARLATLAEALPDLAALHQKSWFLARRPLSELMRPTLGTPAALDPAEPPKATPVVALRVGGAAYRSTRRTTGGWWIVLSESGKTRALRSTDEGKVWHPTSPWQSGLDGLADRCALGDGQPRFRLGRGGVDTPMNLVTEFADGQTWVTPVGEPRDTPIALGCDATGAILAVSGGMPPKVNVLRCRLRAACETLRISHLEDLSPPIPLDVVRVEGVLVVAIAEGDVVRTISSRDEGRTWTPPTVAFDRQQSILFATEVPLGVALVAFGSTIVLLVEVPTHPQGLGLRSDDLGASWRGV